MRVFKKWPGVFARPFFRLLPRRNRQKKADAFKTRIGMTPSR